MSWSFLVTSLVICLAPGTGALYTIAAGLTRGTRAGLLAAFAGTLGTLPHLLAAITGLAALLHTSGLAFATLKYLGVAYLIYLAVVTWRDTGVLSVDSAVPPASTMSVLTTGISVNLLNPKLTIFFFAFLPQFVPSGSTAGLLGLGAVFVAMTFAVFAVYAVLASFLRERVLARPRVLDGLRRSFAASFALLGGRLALESR